MPETKEASGHQEKPANKKKWRSSLWVWLILYGILVLAGMLVGSCFFRNGADRAKFWVEGILTAGILTAVIIQVVINQKQWKVTADTLEETKRIFDMTERPIVIANNATLPGFGEGYKGERLRPEVSFRNCGRTPAQKIRVTAEIAARPAMVYAWGPPRTDKQPQGDWFLGAGEGTTIQAAPADAVSFETEFFKSIRNGKECMLIHGKGSYEDLAGREWPIEYSFKYHAELRGFIPHTHPKVRDETKKTDEN